jgi:V/A-type H+/Na+-transporting ATPase subunit G/H
MEIIKQIKAAEQEAKEIVEQAKSDAIKISEDFVAERDRLKAQAADQRRKAIEAAIADAETKAQQQVKQLKDDGAALIEQMRSEAKSKVDAAATKVVDTLKEM